MMDLRVAGKIDRDRRRRDVADIEVGERIAIDLEAAIIVRKQDQSARRKARGARLQQAYVVDLDVEIFGAF